MSGTNVWLKLRNSKKYKPEPYLLDIKGDVWHLPYGFALNHTVEEILDMCEKADHTAHNLLVCELEYWINLTYCLMKLLKNVFLPKKMTLKQFIKQSEQVFIGLHGGIGETESYKQCLKKPKYPLMPGL